MSALATLLHRNGIGCRGRDGETAAWHVAAAEALAAEWDRIGERIGEGVVTDLSADGGEIVPRSLRGTGLDPARHVPRGDVEAGDYIEDDPAAWAAWLDAIGRYAPDYAGLVTAFGAEAATSILAGTLLSYLASEHAVYLTRKLPAPPTYVVVERLSK